MTHNYGYPVTPAFIGVMERAREQAHRFGHDYIGTEHVLLGLLFWHSPNTLSRSSGYQLLSDMGLDMHVLRAEVERHLTVCDKATPTDTWFPLTPKTEYVIKAAIEFTKEVGHSYVGTDALVYGLTTQKDGIAEPS